MLIRYWVGLGWVVALMELGNAMGYTMGLVFAVVSKNECNTNRKHRRFSNCQQAIPRPR
jgi:hypothetical protein